MGYTKTSRQADPPNPSKDCHYPMGQRAGELDDLYYYQIRLGIEKKSPRVGL